MKDVSMSTNWTRFVHLVSFHVFDHTRLPLTEHISLIKSMMSWLLINSRGKYWAELSAKIKQHFIFDSSYFAAVGKWKCRIHNVRLWCSISSSISFHLMLVFIKSSNSTWFHCHSVVPAVQASAGQAPLLSLTSLLTSLTAKVGGSDIKLFIY